MYGNLAHNMAVTPINQRLREILDGGYNHFVIRPLSIHQSRTALKKKIEARLRMTHFGVAPWAQKKERGQPPTEPIESGGYTNRSVKEKMAHDALLAAYRLIIDEEMAEYREGVAKREPTEGTFIVRLSDGQTRRFFEMSDANKWADQQIKGKPGAQAAFYRHEGKWNEEPFHGLETNEYGVVHVAAVHGTGWKREATSNLAGIVLSPAAIAAQLTERQRATLAWIVENWPYPYRGTPREDVDGLIAIGLLHPYNDERWGDATPLGRGVWKHARKQWRRETDVGAAFKYAKNRAGDPGPASPETKARNVEIATTIAQQLGGTRRLGVMIGAHGFTAGDNSLSFRFKAKAKNGSNAMRIVLEPSDTYRVEFLSIRGTSVKSKGVFEDVYAEDLRRLFESETGLYLSL